MQCLFPPIEISKGKSMGPMLDMLFIALNNTIGSKDGGSQKFLLSFVHGQN